VTRLARARHPWLLWQVEGRRHCVLCCVALQRVGMEVVVVGGGGACVWREVKRQLSSAACAHSGGEERPVAQLAPLGCTGVVGPVRESPPRRAVTAAVRERRSSCCARRPAKRF
jgi:hypothetical protein